MSRMYLGAVLLAPCLENAPSDYTSDSVASARYPTLNVVDANTVFALIWRNGTDLGGFQFDVTRTPLESDTDRVQRFTAGLFLTVNFHSKRVDIDLS